MSEGKELRAAVCRVLDLKRDAELRGRELPLLKLSWVQRQERRAKPLLLVLVFGIYPLSQVAAIVAMRPLVLRNPWYASVLIAWAIVSPLVVFGWGWPKIYRWYSLVCPYCEAMVSVLLPTLSEESAVDVERMRRCRSCRAVIIDPEA